MPVGLDNLRDAVADELVVGNSHARVLLGPLGRLVQVLGTERQRDQLGERVQLRPALMARARGSQAAAR